MLLLTRFSIHVGKGVLHVQFTLGCNHPKASLKRNAQTGLEMVLSTSVLDLSTQNQLMLHKRAQLVVHTVERPHRGFKEPAAKQVKQCVA